MLSAVFPNSEFPCPGSAGVSPASVGVPPTESGDAMPSPHSRRCLTLIRPLLLLAACLSALLSAAQEPGRFAVVIYNSKMPESKAVAEHYAAARAVPRDQLFGFALPKSETITRADYAAKLQQPLLDRLQTQGLLTFDSARASNGLPLRVVPAKIRYAVVCYGVPLRILEDTALVEPDAAKMQLELRRNGAALDAELTVLPSSGAISLTGPLDNPYYAATNTAPLHPGNGILLVGRLDGPNAAIARQLVDKAIEAETDGLWGRGYFDARGLTNGPFLEGDQWIKAAAETTRRFGFDTVLDDNPECFPADFPMSQIALYAGWYDSHANGPFVLPQVEFMPGAFAYHLYSVSASTLRDTDPANRPWCAALLAGGATATIGYVDEPFLEGTANLGVFFARWLEAGFSLGEAAFVSQRALSWQTTVIGDPMYRPFTKTPRAQHENLLARKSPLVAWSFVRIINAELRMGASLPDMIKLLAADPLAARSAVLSEKLGDLCVKSKDYPAAILAYQQALTLNPTPQQLRRLHLSLDAVKKSNGP